MNRKTTIKLVAFVLILCILFVGCNKADTTITSSNEPLLEGSEELRNYFGERYISCEVLLEDTHTQTADFTRTTVSTLFVVDTTTGKEVVLMQKQTFDNDLSDRLSFTTMPKGELNLQNAELVFADGFCAIYLPETSSMLCRYGKNETFFVEVRGVEKATLPIIEGAKSEFFEIDETTPHSAIVYCITPEGERFSAFYDAEQKTIKKLGDYNLYAIEHTYYVGDKRIVPYINAVVTYDKGDLYTPVTIVTKEDMKIDDFFIPLSSLEVDRNNSSRCVLGFITSKGYLGFLTLDSNGNYKNSFVTEMEIKGQGEITINIFLDNIIYFTTAEGRFAIDVREGRNHTPQLVK